MRRLILCLCLGGCDHAKQPLIPADAAADAARDATPMDAARDAAPADAAPADAGRDAATTDAGRDAATTDAARDAAPSDAAPTDAAPTDAAPDAGLVDMGLPGHGDALPGLDAALEVDAGPPAPDAAPAVDAAAPPTEPNHGLDTFPYRCADPAWRPAACAPGVGEFHESIGAQHIADDVDIPPYALTPPSSGPHRGRWGRWGEYISLPPERWLHNLEHGGIAVLYHPCAPAEVVTALRELVRARPEGEALRWVMTPYPDMQATVALTAWEWRYQAHCIQVDELNLFFDRYHAQGPEDVAGHGGYIEGWIGP